MALPDRATGPPSRRTTAPPTCSAAASCSSPFVVLNQPVAGNSCRSIRGWGLLILIPRSLGLAQMLSLSSFISVWYPRSAASARFLGPSSASLCTWTVTRVLSRRGMTEPRVPLRGHAPSSYTPLVPARSRRRDQPEGHGRRSGQTGRHGGVPPSVDGMRYAHPMHTAT